MINKDNSRLILSSLKTTELEIEVKLVNEKRTIYELANLAPGSVIVFKHPIARPVGLYANNKKVAEGKVVRADIFYGLRISKVINGEDEQ